MLAPSCFETHRSAPRLPATLALTSRCDALSMRATGRDTSNTWRAAQLRAATYLILVRARVRAAKAG